jgi:NTE family protein
MINRFENLALEGGGVWGIAYAGALDELEKVGILAEIKRVAGTSVGSILALLLALGYSSNDISNIIAQLDFTKFMDHHSVKQLFSTYGLYQGEFAMRLFQSWIADKLGTEDATFKDLHDSGGLELRVFATNLNTKQIHEFSFRKTSDVPLAVAVRASMSVPLFFAAVEVGDHLFVDGGAIFDYPLLAFGDTDIKKTLGLAFAGSSSAAAGDQDETSFSYHQPGEYIHRLLTVMERVQAPLLALYGDLRENTILIDTGDISSLQFKLSKDDQDFLIQSGRKAVKDYIQKEQVVE